MLRKLVAAVAALTCLLVLPIASARAQGDDAPSSTVAAQGGGGGAAATGASESPSSASGGSGPDATSAPADESSSTPEASPSAARQPTSTAHANQSTASQPTSTARVSSATASTSGAAGLPDATRDEAPEASSQVRDLTPLAAVDACSAGRVVGNVGANLVSIDVATATMTRLTNLSESQFPGVVVPSGQSGADFAQIYSMDVNTDGTLALLAWRDTSYRLNLSTVNIAGGTVTNRQFTYLGDASYRGGWNSLDQKFYYTLGNVLYAYNPTTMSNDPLGTITSAVSSQALYGGGDLYFDRSGNMFLVSAQTGATSSLFRVDAAQIAARTLVATKLVDLVGIPVNAQTNANGVAFASDGYLYVSVSTSGDAQLLKIDPSSGAQIGATLTLNSPGGAIPAKVGDLGNCVSPRTLTVVKNIAGRAVAADQFTVRLQSGNSTQSATTIGSTLGPQTATQVGPAPVIPGNAYALSELPGNTGTRLARYDTSWRCTAAVTGAVVATGTGTSLTLLYPADSVSNGAITCTVTNTPVAATLTVQKQWVFAGPGMPSGTIPNSGLGAALQAAGFGADAVASSITDVTLNGAGVTSPGWGGALAAFRSDTVGVTETVTFRGALAQCSWQQEATVATLTSGSVATTSTTTSQTFTGTLAAGAQTLTVTNRVVCTRLTLAKQVDNTAAGTSSDALQPSAWGGKLRAAPIVGGASIASQYVNGGFVGQYVTAGTYQLSEDLVAGYAQQALTCVALPGGTPVAVTAQGRLTLTAGQDVTCTFANAAQRGQVTWSKRAEGGGADLLAGSAWRIDGPGGQQFTVADCVVAPCTGADQNPAVGAFAVTGLGWGAYTLNETVAPPGYVRNSTPIPFTVGAGDTPGSGALVAVGVVLNATAPPVVLPLTGGQGADGYLLVGGALLALALAAGAAVRQRVRPARRPRP